LMNNLMSSNNQRILLVKIPSIHQVNQVSIRVALTRA
jgi:hypothetical protein